MGKLTVTLYREKNPNCEYCEHKGYALKYCPATKKKMSKRTAKKCPCYTPEKWYKEK